MILKVLHGQVGYPKGAEEEARKFYCGVLGLKAIPKPESLRDRGGFWLELGDFQVHLSPEDGVDRSATKAHLAYQINNLEEWKCRFAREGVQVKDGIPIPGWSRFECRDPFGNRMEFMQKLTQ